MPGPAPESAISEPLATDDAAEIVDGLDLLARRSIFVAAAEAGRAATAKAELGFPLDRLPDGVEEVRRYLAGQTDVYEAAWARGRGEILTRYEIDAVRLEAIEAEGQRERWPAWDGLKDDEERKKRGKRGHSGFRPQSFDVRGSGRMSQGKSRMSPFPLPGFPPVKEKVECPLSRPPFPPPFPAPLSRPLSRPFPARAIRQRPRGGRDLRGGGSMATTPDAARRGPGNPYPALAHVMNLASAPRSPRSPLPSPGDRRGVGR